MVHVYYESNISLSLFHFPPQKCRYKSGAKGALKKQFANRKPQNISEMESSRQQSNKAPLVTQFTCRLLMRVSRHIYKLMLEKETFTEYISNRNVMLVCKSVLKTVQCMSKVNKNQTHVNNCYTNNNIIRLNYFSFSS